MKTIIHRAVWFHHTVAYRYRKIHLYAEGDRRPSPDQELAYFDTDFGVRFGLLTCFDIIFKNPGVDLAREHNISHFIFTSAWFSQMPFLTGILCTVSDNIDCVVLLGIIAE